MDPITGAVVAIVLWFIFAWVGWGVIYVSIIGIGAAINDGDGAFGGAILGWILGAIWWVFAIIQAILQVVHLVQLLGVGG